MKIIWDAIDDKLTTRDIEARLAAIDGKRRNVSSLMTVIARLVDKGFLNPVKKFRESTYFEALIQETEYKLYATNLFISSIHCGKLSSLISTLLECDQFTELEIDELRKMLDQNQSK